MLKVALGDWVYVAVVLTTSDSSLKVSVPQCYATPEMDPTSEPKYYLIKNKYVSLKPTRYLQITFASGKNNNTVLLYYKKVTYYSC